MTVLKKPRTDTRSERRNNVEVELHPNLNAAQFSDHLKFWTALQIRDIKQLDEWYSDQTKADTYQLKSNLRDNGLVWDHYIPENDVADNKLKTLINKLKAIDAANFGGSRQKLEALALFEAMCAENYKTSRPQPDQVAIHELIRILLQTRM